MEALIIDTSADCTSLLLGLLEEEGHEVDIATPETAWDVFRAHRPQLVLLSSVEPASLELVRRIRDEGRSERILVLAIVSPDVDELDEVVEAGVDDCVQISAGPDFLRACIRMVDRRAQNRAVWERIEHELAARVRQQAVLARIGQRVLQGTSLDHLFKFAVERVAVALQAGMADIWLVDGDEQRLRKVAATGWGDDAGVEAVAVEDDSAYAAALRHEAPSVLSGDGSAAGALPAHCRSRGAVEGVIARLDGEDSPLGVLGVYTTESRPFSEDDIQFLQSVANLLASTIERKRMESALRESEARARGIVETTVDGVITIDAEGNIESFNTAAETIFGYAADEVIGQNVKVLMPSPYHEEHDGYIQSYHDTGRRHIIGIGREVVGRRKDGSTFPLDLAVSEIHLGDRVIFTGIVRDITERRNLEHEILRISEQERRRIGQDLHDGLGQMLTGIGLISQNLARQLKTRSVPAAKDVAEITDMIKEADQYARGLARGLVPVDLESKGLASALQRLAVNAERLFGIRCTFEEVGSPLLHDNTAATHLYRIAQEAVSNAVKHGRARRVKISLAGGNRQIRLRIQDDGSGFPDELDEETRGMGVRIMQHRARIIGASLDISGGADAGTVITCTIRNANAPIPMGGEEYGRTA